MAETSAPSWERYAGDFTVDDGRAEILFGGVVSQWDIRAVEEDEQVGSMRLVAILESTGVGRVGLVREGGTEDEAIDGVLDAASAPGERRRGDHLANLVQMDDQAQQTAQLDGPDPSGVAIGLDGVSIFRI